MKKYLLISLSLLISTLAWCQIDSSLIKKPTPEVQKGMNMDAVYNRPFLNSQKAAVSLGGYYESHWQHLTEDGISTGNNFQFRRMSLFLASSISKRIKFLSEIEFENEIESNLSSKGLEIDIEYAAIDFEFNGLLNLRSGIILNPIGAFNQNHDGPKWEFIDRPIAMTQLLPATFSNVGMGIYGKKYVKNWMIGYELYSSGGFDGSIIDNPEGRTQLTESKENPSRLTANASGSPLYSGKLAIRNSQWFETGFSTMHQIYNQYTIAGKKVDNPRELSVFAWDVNISIPKINTNIISEWAWINVQLPQNYAMSYGSQQFGGFIDVVQPIFKGTLFGWEKSVLNLAVRYEYADWNRGTFSSGIQKYDQTKSIMPGISYRPNRQTVLRFNYRIQKYWDLSGATINTTHGPMFGISSYF